MSVAAVDGDGLVYVAAVGDGAERIVGVRLSAGRGIAGYVAATGQATIIDRTVDDPRFARDVAAGTGYVPDTLLVVPVIDGDGDVAGVLSVLDRTVSPSGDALAVAASLADLAAVVWTTAATGDDDTRSDADDPEVEALIARLPLVDPAVRVQILRLWVDAIDLAARR